MLTIPESRTSRCVRYRYRYSTCQRCADACPHEAVTLSDEGVAIDAVRCQNCALCAAVCPTETLLADNLPRIDLLKLAIKQKKFSFACAPSAEKGDAVVPCLGALDAAMLSYLASRGIAVELLGSEHCTYCAHAPKGAEQLAMHLEGLALLREAAGDEQWAETAVVKRGNRVDGGSRDMHQASRRQMFRRLVGRGIDAATHPGAQQPDAPVPSKAIRIAAPFMTEQRELLHTLWQSKAENQHRIEPHPALHMAQMKVKEGCTACEACARVCPTGALRIVEGSTAWALTFQFSRCIGCDVCLEVCQPGVLQPLEVIDLVAEVEKQPVILHRLSKKRCNRCDRFFISAVDSENCPICEGDDEDFTEIFG